MRHLLPLLASAVCYAPPGDGGGALEALGSVRAINAGTSAEDLNTVLETHANAIREVSGDLARRAERIERMMPDTAALVSKARAEARSEWVPHGDAHHLDARYIQGEEIRFGSVTERVLVPGPNGVETVEQVRHGLLTDPNTVTVEHERVRKAYAAYGLARAIASKRDGMQPLVRKAFMGFRSALMALPGRTGEMLRTALTDPNLFQRVISNVAGTGGNLIATPTLSTVIRPADMARRLAGLVPIVEVAGSTFKQPIVTGRALARRRGATTDDPARYPVQTFTTSDQTLSVVDRVIQVLLDDTWATEQAMVLGDPMGLVMDWIAMGDADTLELAFMHGDTTATHQDTISTWTMGSRYTAGQLDGTNSPMRFWNGIRAEAFDRSATVAGGGTLDAADHFGALALMGTLAAGARVNVGLRCFYEQFLANALFTTVDKAGAAATLQTGQLGQIGDTPIDLTDTLAKEYASTGLYTGSGTTNTAVYWNPGAYAHYFHSGGSTDWDVAQPDRGAQIIGMKRRSLLYKTCLSTEVPAAAIINL